ncbi:(d)CMP kinase, partial [Kaarinaea lacus]
MNSQENNKQLSPAPVITIDGPTASGKGTISRMLAQQLGWHMLDSGALYRLVALKALNLALALDDESNVAQLASELDIEFDATEAGTETQVILEGENVTNSIRTEQCGAAASKVAALPKVRQALLQRQREFAQPPGLIADGRDMGTV